MIIPAAPFPSDIHWLTLVLSPVSKSVWGWQLKHRDWDVIQEVFTVAPTGVSGGTIIRAVTVAGRRGNNRFGGEGSARTGPLQLLCWFTWRAEVEESAWITRDREDAAEDVSLNLNAAVYQMPLIPSQVWLIRNRRQHPMSEWNRWAEAHRETFARAENINTNTDVRSFSTDCTGTKSSCRQTPMLASGVLFCTINHWHVINTFQLAKTLQTLTDNTTQYLEIL